MIFPTGGDVPRHPSQLYQALLEGLLLFILLWLYARKPRYRGQVSAAFLIGYGVFRFIVEYWREPDAYLGFLSLGWSMGQWLSAPMVVLGLALWLWSQKRRISDVEPIVEPSEEESAADVDPALETPVDNTTEAVEDVGRDEASTPPSTRDA